MLNITLNELEETSCILLLNTNLRLEHPLINSRLRKNFLKRSKELLVLSFGQAINYAGYPVTNLGANLKIFLQFIQGKYYYFTNIFFNSLSFRSLSFFNIFYPFHLRTVILVGSSSLAFRVDFKGSFLAALYFSNLLSKHSFTTKNIFNVLSNNLGEISFKELALGGPNKRNFYSKKVLRYYLATNSLFSTESQQDFSVFQGSHLPKLHNIKSIVLFFPATNYVERTSTYLNLLGRLRLTKVAVASPVSILSDLEIFRLLILLKKRLVPHNFSFFPNFYETTEFFNFLINYHCCFFGTLNKFLENFRKTSGFSLRAFVSPQPFYKPMLLFLFPLKIFSSPLNKIFINYYAMDFFTRASKVMGLCSARLIISTFSE